MVLRATSRTVLALALLVLGAGSAGALEASLTISTGHFDTRLSSYFGVPRSEVLLLHRRGLAAGDLPVAFYVARRARVAPSAVVELRLGGSSWNDIYHRYGLGPQILYVPMDDPYGPYQSLYSFPVDHWGYRYFSDADYVNLANLRFMRDAYGYEPVQVVRLRSRGDDFLSIASVLAGSIAQQSGDGGAVYLNGETLGAYDLAMSGYYGLPQEEVLLAQDYGLPYDEMPVALFVASQAHVQPTVVVQLRLGGSSWDSIYRRYDLGPDLLYLPTVSAVGPYRHAYQLFRSQPRSRWRSIRLRDADYVNLANLRFASQYYNEPARRIMELRARRTGFAAIHRDYLRARPQLLAQVRRQPRLLTAVRTAAPATRGRPAIGAGEARKLEGRGRIGAGEARKLGLKPQRPGRRAEARASRAARAEHLTQRRAQRPQRVLPFGAARRAQAAQKAKPAQSRRPAARAQRADARPQHRGGQAKGSQQRAARGRGRQQQMQVFRAQPRPRAVPRRMAPQRMIPRRQGPPARASVRPRGRGPARMAPAGQRGGKAAGPRGGKAAGQRGGGGRGRKP